MKNYTSELSISEVILKTDDMTKKYDKIYKLISDGQVRCRNVQYGFGLVYSFHIAELCGYNEFDIIEFGVSPVPNGLIDLKNISDQIQAHAGTNFKINIIGFDRESGMPMPSSYKDHPEIWQENLWGIEPLTFTNAKFAKIYSGELHDTVQEYIDSIKETSSRIGFIVFDLDQYQGTKVATNILKIDPKYIFPCLPMFWDDLYSTPLMSEYTGPFLAAKEFNEENDARKIDLKQLYMQYFTSFLQVLDHPMRTGQEKPTYPLFLKHFIR